MNAEQQGAYIAGKLNAAIDTIAHDVVAKLVRDGVGDEWENYPEVGMDDWHAVVKRALEIVGQVDPDPDQFRAAYDYLTERAEK